MSNSPTPKPPAAPSQEARVLSPEAQRALQEAAERRRQAEASAQASAQNGAKEIGGQKGPDPVRYGDWEKGGIASDF
jgi:hypothetical protein